MAAKKQGKKRGPKPETLKVAGDWKAAVGRALARGKPPTEPKPGKKAKGI
jgi:hypothetical protein